jgi:hypothetical protein
MMAQATPGTTGSVGQAGLVVGVAGLVTALGAVLVPLARIWSENRAADRRSKEERHELANGLHVAKLEIELNRREIAEAHKREEQLHEAIGEYRKWMSELSAKVPGLSPVPPAPQIVPEQSKR